MKYVASILVLASIVLCGELIGFTHVRNDSVLDQRLIIADEMQAVLTKELDQWYPRCIDSLYGGYFSDFDYQWKLNGSQNKMIVTQARHVWSASNATLFFKNDTMFRKYAHHGVDFLSEKMWDKDYGGFYELVSREGTPILTNEYGAKTAYGNAFAIYGLATYYRISGDTLALKLAQKAFWWLEKHSYDSKYGGYIQHISRGGSPYNDGLIINSSGGILDSTVNTIPPKNQNSSIHVLEAFIELYRIWPDSIVRERLNSILHVVRDVCTTPQGYLTLFFQQNWKSVTFKYASAEVRVQNYYYDHVSFGHDVETAYLMIEALNVLGIRNDTITLRIAKKMVDHALINGWDKEHGGLFDGGYYMPGDEKCKIIRRTKEWWAQAEALNSFLLMAELYPIDILRYYEKFLAQWDYCRRYVIDNQYGGWYWGGADIVPSIIKSPKGSIWKGNYHTSRSLINCINRLHNKVEIELKKVAR